MQSISARQLAGLGFALLAGLFLTVIMLGAGLVAGYDVTNGAISDLGTAPESAFLFNSTLVLVGFLNLVATWLPVETCQRRGQLIIGTLAAIGAIGAGIFTLDAAGIHGLFALGAFVFFNIQTALQARACPPLLKLLGWLLAALGLVYVVIMFFGDMGNTALFGPIGHGGAERMIVYPPMLWLLVYGGYLMAPARAVAA